jgi:hypothetical protein
VGQIKHKMKKTIIAGAVLFCGILTAQTTVKGNVFEDLNQNGKKDKSEKGIAAVAVTNGSEVVLTDKKGNYELPVKSDAIIAVIKPSGYQIGVNKDNLPQFFL